jgi:hypothetical protein
VPPSPSPYFTAPLRGTSWAASDPLIFIGIGLVFI